MRAAPRPVLRPLLVRSVAGAAVALLLVLVGALPVLAHGGVVPQPRVESVPDGLDGLEVVGLVQGSPRIRVTNPDDEVLTVVDDSGRPWLQISAAGVFADLSVRAWSESLDASGRGTDPDPATPSAWTQISVLPTWEWFDTSLLPRTGQDEDHGWSIPVVVDGRFDEITGTLEESTLQGRWATDLVGSIEVGGARVTAVSGAVPVFVVQRLETEEVVVLGRFGEPVLRLTDAGFEVNRASPTWNDHARLDRNAVLGDVVEDPDADPVWEVQLAGAPTATWVDVRAASPDVVPARRSATVIEATIPMLVDGERHDVEVVTRWVGDEVPLLALRLTWPTLAALSLGAGLVAAGAVRAWERRRGGDADADADGDGDQDAEEPAPTL